MEEVIFQFSVGYYFPFSTSLKERKEKKETRKLLHKKSKTMMCFPLYFAARVLFYLPRLFNCTEIGTYTYLEHVPIYQEMSINSWVYLTLMDVLREER